MATIKKQEAVDRLIESVKTAQADDLVGIYNDLFPAKPTTESEAIRNPTALVQKILAHIDSGLEVEEMLDLRYAIFPKQRGVWFDEDDELFHYDENYQSAELLD